MHKRLKGITRANYFLKNLCANTNKSTEERISKIPKEKGKKGLILEILNYPNPRFNSGTQKHKIESTAKKGQTQQSSLQRSIKTIIE